MHVSCLLASDYKTLDLRDNPWENAALRQEEPLESEEALYHNLQGQREH